jgi:hypothetical protein
VSDVSRQIIINQSFQSNDTICFLNLARFDNELTVFRVIKTFQVHFLRSNMEVFTSWFKGRQPHPPTANGLFSPIGVGRGSRGANDPLVGKIFCRENPLRTKHILWNWPWKSGIFEKTTPFKILATHLLHDCIATVPGRNSETLWWWWWWCWWWWWW